MEAAFTFAPKSKTLRKFDLIEAQDLQSRQANNSAAQSNLFLLIGTDKLTKMAHIIRLNQLPDTRKNLQLSDIIHEGSQALNPK